MYHAGAMSVAQSLHRNQFQVIHNLFLNKSPYNSRILDCPTHTHKSFWMACLNIVIGDMRCHFTHPKNTNEESLVVCAVVEVIRCGYYYYNCCSYTLTNVSTPTAPAAAATINTFEMAR